MWEGEREGEGVVVGGRGVRECVKRSRIAYQRTCEGVYEINVNVCPCKDSSVGALV